MKNDIIFTRSGAAHDAAAKPRSLSHRRVGASLAVRVMLGSLAAASLMLLAPAAYADTATCTATSGYWRWGGGTGARLDLATVVGVNNYLDALRATESFRDVAATDPTNSSRAGLDVTMPKRFTTGPQPWGVSYADKNVVGLANFVSTTGNLPSFTLGSACVPAGATINSVKVRVTHAIVDPNGPQAENYAARIGVNNGSGSVFTTFDLTGANLVAGGTVPSGSTGTSNEVTTDASASPAGAGDIDVTSVLSSAALVNAALVQFQARRTSGEAALHTIINEISLLVDYTGGATTSADHLTKLVTGGGYITSGTYSGGKGNFGFNARSSSTDAPPVPGTGNFEYNDGKLQVHGTVDTISLCSPSLSGGSFTFSGTFNGRVGTGKLYSGSGDFTAAVVDNGEPGKGVDTIALTLTTTSGTINGFSGFSTTTLAGGNIQYHFCDLP